MSLQTWCKLIIVHTGTLDRDSWVDVHNPSGTDCDEPEEPCDFRQHSAGDQSVAHTPEYVMSSENGQECVKMRDKGAELRGVECSNHHHPVCSVDCGGASSNFLF